MQKRLSVQSATHSLTVASTNSPERSERRLSRLSASEFDSILESDKTLLIAGTDESQLGHSVNASTSTAAPSSEQRNALRTSPPADTRELPDPAIAQNENISLRSPSSNNQRRSMTRSSNPDLSSPGRRADSTADLASQRSAIGKSSLDSERSAPPTPTKDVGPDAGAQRRASQAQLAFSAQPQAARGHARAGGIDRTSPAPARISLPPALDPNPPLPPPHSPELDRSATANYPYNGEYSSRASLAPTGPDKANRASMIFVDADESHRSSFSNTMRRTSRFFKRLGGGGGSSTAPTPPTVKIEAPRTAATPIAQAFQSPDHGTISETRPGIARETPLPHTPSKAPLEPDTPTREPLPAPIPYSPMKTPTSTRQRDTSTEDIEAAHTGPAGQTVTSPRSLNAPGPERPGQRLSRDEEDRLLNELQRWKLDENGVLTGEAGDSPLAKRSPLARKRLEMPSFAPEEQNPQPGLSTQPWPSQASGSPRKTSWHGDASPLREHFVEPIVTQRSNSLPPTASIPSSTQLRDTTEDGRPSIRLVSPTHSSKELPQEPIGTLAQHSNANAAAVARGAEEAALNSKPGHNLGLETIIESAHSRDNSLATPTKAEASPMSRTSPTPLPSFALSSSPSPASISASATIDPGAQSNQWRGTFPRASGSNQSLPRTPTNMSNGRSVSSAHLLLDTSQPLEEQAKAAAQKCWDEDPAFLDTKKIAEWLGSSGQLNARALEYWCNNFDFNGIRLDAAFRRLCDKLFLKGETQQVDRILAQFSMRYFETNPKTIYGSADVVHAVAYSLLLLNTDLHIVDTTTRMTRQQFVRNTLSAIASQSDDPALSTQPALLFKPDYKSSDCSENVFGSPGNGEATKSSQSLDGLGGSRHASVVSLRATEDAATTPVPTVKTPSSTSIRGESPERYRTVRSESILTMNSNRSADTGLENLLKDMYTAIKAQPIFQPQGSSTPTLPSSHSRSSLSLSPGSSPYATWSGAVHRSASRRSATSTMSAGSSSAYKRSSVRGFGSLLGASSSVELPRSSSPTPSTATSIDDENLSTAYGSQSQQHHQARTIGFANSLSHTIIREQHEDDGASDDVIDITEEELALLGAPWAKEGLLQRKHYWESTGKRAKEKSWLQAFVVISAGQVKMFRFDTGGSSRGPGGGMGGGDWTSNAHSVGEVSLIHALCSAMPPPGYSRDRPHCFVLTLPTGGSYFFQAGTQDLVAEWVSTCNYWSARLSKEPLSGGVSNMEYGWNRVGTASSEVDLLARDETMSIRSGHSRRSYQHMVGGGSSGQSANPNDRITINEWKSPNVPSGACQLSEDAQLENLKRHIAIVRQELAAHNLLRAPMTKLYSPRSANGSKAAANWERKSQHLLAEVVKYQTYIDALASAIKLRGLKRGQKELEMMLKEADTALDDDEDLAMISPTDGPPPSFTLGDEELEIDSEADGARSSPAQDETRTAAGRLGHTPQPSVGSVTTNGEEQEYVDAQGSA